MPEADPCAPLPADPDPEALLSARLGDGVLDLRGLPAPLPLHLALLGLAREPRLRLVLDRFPVLLLPRLAERGLVGTWDEERRELQVGPAPAGGAVASSGKRALR